jgi:hypothetical protein
MRKRVQARAKDITMRKRIQDRENDMKYVKMRAQDREKRVMNKE